MFGELEDIIQKAIMLDENKAWFQVIDREAQWEIIRLNTIDQLFDEGIKADGTYLPDYSKTSVEVYGKRDGHIQLKDSGEFYRSFVVKVDSRGYEIIADTQKENTDLSVKYGLEILGLTDENMILVNEMLKQKYIEYIEEKLFY